MSARLEQDGFVWERDLFGPDALRRMVQALEGSGASAAAQSRGGCRNLLQRTPALVPVLRDSGLPEVCRKLLGRTAFVVRAILFDKVEAANWKVIWHQDLTVAVLSREEAPGFGPWTVKEGVVHVQAPAAVLGRMVAARIHLDPCGEENGPLRVIPGSHLKGKLVPDEVDRRRRGEWVTCTADAGDVLFFRPLLLHASSAADRPTHRRVIHLELACEDLPSPLEWNQRCALSVPDGG